MVDNSINHTYSSGAAGGTKPIIKLLNIVGTSVIITAGLFSRIKPAVLSPKTQALFIFARSSMSLTD